MAIAQETTNLGANNEHRLIPPSFFALTFHNELEYRHLNARFNSDDDASASCKNLVRFVW